MAKKVISVEYQIPGFSQDYHEYSSDQSLLDADVIVFKPEQFYLPSGGGKPSFDESGSFEIQKNARHWQTELLVALEYGKTVFLILGKYQIASIRTGQTEIKGRTHINYVTDYSNYTFLPISLPPMTAKSGAEIVFTGDPVFAIFWKELGKYLKYECYLNQKVPRPIFVTKTGERPIGAVFKVKKGHLVTLPLLEYDEETFLKRHKNGESHWTKEALKFGNTLVSQLLNIDRLLKSEQLATPPPEWVMNSEFLSQRETGLRKAIDNKKEEVQKLKIQEESLQSELRDEQQLKNLLFETGKPLEAAVICALRILGYSAENYNDGELELDQLILSPEGDRFIGECEGKDNSAVNIDKLRQLSENIQADLQKESVDKPAIGILFGNGFRLTAPKDRPTQFTEKCLSSAKRGTVLIQTMDMYPVIRYIQETNDQDYMKQCRDAILAGIGHIVGFPTPPSNSKRH